MKEKVFSFLWTETCSKHMKQLQAKKTNSQCQPAHLFLLTLGFLSGS